MMSVDVKDRLNRFSGKRAQSRFNVVVNGS
jgi:hypothetical protein